ncbi:MAG: hypothetical protein DRR06_08215 [Gammaproteobacteria bacterium]|nr:MAG: hypothetical protein DRR06_08215 [Gammaproteobacteria bacterium]RLA50855.1 MAG: hypothetical protein DRR42_11945 [Gammaproteobacteria bacterium]
MNTAPLANNKLAAILWILLALFCFRVAAQLIQFYYPTSLLPPFESWHSEKVPYGILVLAQLVIIYFCLRTAYGVYRGTTNRNRTRGIILLALGGLYFATMVVRVSLGLTVFSDNRWFSNHIPTFFHFVLATFILMTSSYHFQSPDKANNPSKVNK